MAGLKFSIEIPAGELQQALTMLSAKGGTKPLFTPLKVLVRGSTLLTSTMSMSGSAFVVGAWKKINSTGDGYFVIDPEVFLSRLSLFSSDEPIHLSCFDDNHYELFGRHDHVTYYPPDESYCKFHDKLPFKIIDNKLHYMQGKLAPKSFIKIDASELAKFPHRASMIGVSYYQFHFSPEGSWGIVGDYLDKKLTPIKTQISAMVEGSPLDITLADSFEEIVNVLQGEWSISGHPEVDGQGTPPLWLFRKTEQYQIGYEVSARMKVAE